MKTVDQLMAEAFSPPRGARSQAYKAGVRAALEWWINKKRIVVPYLIGTAEFDAFFAGRTEGYAIWQRETGL
ncbi:hypothetical protein SAMN05216428_101110 [Nitrosospira sp. Nsp11]|uniref:hypothetical protein n=1 Tax=Nitrosospira sp. Nsp11 TaxID=1855338 RepID=UPI00091E0F26|nr:hypothetical protein [Nitrosospira sp. Nsp11]SHL11189.1 hypothetical protein SAMN05216428_101110 [Nitrosospira sp. Nsp11]